MYNLAGRSKIDELMPLVGKSTVASMLPSYPYSSAMRAVVNKIERTSAIVTGPIYQGEAEALFLEPLYDSALAVINNTYNPGDIAKKAYSRGVAYSAIAEWILLSQQKEMAATLNIEMIQKNPLYTALRLNSPSFNIEQKTIVDDGMGGKNPKSTVEGSTYWERLQSEETIYKDSRELAVSMRKYLDVKPLDALDHILNFMLVPADSDINASLMDISNTLKTDAKKGKGIALSLKSRTKMISKRAAIVAAVRKLSLSSNRMIPSSAEDMLRQMDGLLLACAYLLYLKSVEDYDANWPAQPFQSQSLAWILTLQSTAQDLSSLWTYLATIPAEFSLAMYRQALNEHFQVFEPLFSDLVGYKDLMTLKGEYEGLLSQLIKPFIAELAVQPYNNMKSFSGATYILPNTDEYKDMINKILALSDKLPSEVTTESAISLITSGQFQYWPYSSRGLLLSKFLDSFEFMRRFTDYVLRAKSLMAMVYQDQAELTSPFTLDAGLFPTLPVRGSMENIPYLDFSMCDPLSLQIPKWEPKELSFKWTHMDSLFKPHYYRTHDAKKVQTTPYMTWCSDAAIPGDIVTAAFTQQLIPACYTNTRSRHVQSYDIRTWMDAMKGVTRDVVMSDYFDTIKDLLIAYPNTPGSEYPNEYATAIADALAATFFIYCDTGSGSLKLIRPQLPAIYGAPVQAMINANKIQDTISTSQIEKILKDKTGFVTDDHKAVFLMHKVYPKPYQTVSVGYSPTRGITILVPVWEDIFDAAALTKPDLADIGVIVSKKDAAADRFVEAQGISMFSRAYPHVNFDVVSPTVDITSADWRVLSIVKATIYTHPISKDLCLRGVLHDDIRIMDYADYKTARDASDPLIPVMGTSAAEIKPELPNGREEEVLSNIPTGGKVDIVSATPVPQQENKPSIGAPVIVEVGSDEGTKPTFMQGNPTTNPSIKSTPLQGDPTDASAVTPDKTQPKKSYYKRINADGTIQDVIEVEEGEDVPAGFVPATKDEYEKAHGDSK